MHWTMSGNSGAISLPYFFMVGGMSFSCCFVSVRWSETDHGHVCDDFLESIFLALESLVLLVILCCSDGVSSFPISS